METTIYCGRVIAYPQLVCDHTWAFVAIVPKDSVGPCVGGASGDPEWHYQCTFVCKKCYLQLQAQPAEMGAEMKKIMLEAITKDEIDTHDLFLLGPNFKLES